MSKNGTKRVALYLRVSTGEQTTENQRRELEAVAKQRGWQIVAVYEDKGVSGAKGRDKRPQFDAMLKDAVRAQFDVLAAWAVDRLGRSLQDLVATLSDLHGAGVDLFLHRQAIDSYDALVAGRAVRSPPPSPTFHSDVRFPHQCARAIPAYRVPAGLALDHGPPTPIRGVGPVSNQQRTASP